MMSLPTPWPRPLEKGEDLLETIERTGNNFFLLKVNGEVHLYVCLSSLMYHVLTLEVGFHTGFLAWEEGRNFCFWRWNKVDLTKCTNFQYDISVKKEILHNTQLLFYYFFYCYAI